jgi:ubiquitin-conjugating enzyme E2 I
MSGLAISRLSQERKSWRKSHPADFYARPMMKSDNSSDLMNWECGVPGRPGTDWENGVYKVLMVFPASYPSRPPVCKFVPALYHPNVYPCGTICLSILSQDWSPSITMTQILCGIQELLDNPNDKSPAQDAAYQAYTKNRPKYKKLVREQALRNIPDS